MVVVRQGVDMSEISGERIRDEFIKGIKTSKSTIHFLGLLDKYNLLAQVFPNMGTNRKAVESNDPDVVIASLLVGSGNVEKQLNALKYPSDDINNIQFLINLVKFEPSQVVGAVKKRRNSKLTDEQIMSFVSLNGLDSKLVQALLSFRLTINGNEVMQQYGIKGAEVGKMINKLETNKFRATL